VNIFATSADPSDCALALDDKRVNKMALEVAQMLSTSLNRRGWYSKLLYRSFNPNHPACKWVNVNRSNFLWTVEHGLALCEVYSSVYKKDHASKPIIKAAASMADKIPVGSGERTVFANCAANKEFGLDFKHLPVLTAYRAYLNERWKRDSLPCTWKNRGAPAWRQK
jgi:hypothetical protein